MIKSKVEVFTSKDGTKFFSHAECQHHEIEALSASTGIPNQSPTDFILSNSDALLEILKPARKPRVVKPKPAKEAKAKAKTPATA